MSKRFSILLVMLTIVSGLVGGVISGKFFATRTVIAAETKQHAKVIEAEEFRLVDKNGKLFGKFAISDDIKISSIEYGTSPALILYSSDGKLTANLGITEVLQPDIGVSLSSASLLLQSSDSGHCVDLSTSSSGSGLSFFGMTPLKNHISISDSDSEGAKIGVYSSVDGKCRASMQVGKHDNGLISVMDSGKGVAEMSVNEYGGCVDVYSNIDSMNRVSMQVGKDDNGIIATIGKNDKGRAEMSVNEYGGRVDVFGKVDKIARTTMQINEYGYGAIGLWDKDGYRLK